MMRAPTRTIFYDRECGLCDRVVRFVLARDRREVFSFAALQSDVGAAMLTAVGADPSKLDTAYVIGPDREGRPRVWRKGSAIGYILRRLPRWRILGGLLWLIPRPLLNLGYTLVAKTRYRLFGRIQSCELPTAELRHRFVDLGVDER